MSHDPSEEQAPRSVLDTSPEGLLAALFDVDLQADLSLEQFARDNDPSDQ